MNFTPFRSFFLLIVIINSIQCANIEESSDNIETPTTEAVTTEDDESLRVIPLATPSPPRPEDLLIGENTSVTSVTTEDDESLRVIPLSTPSPPQSDKVLLIGENTPVWIAYRPDSEKPVNYTRLQNGIISEAIAYWNSQRSSGINFKTKRSINSYNFEYAASKMRRSTSKVEVSFLVVMDYNTPWPSEESAQKKNIKEKILYALAFWNAFNRNLRDVNLRIAGFVIARNKEAVPYLRESESEDGVNVIDVRGKMNEYWKNISKHNSDFPLDSYHCLATMTDSNPQPYEDVTVKYWDRAWEPPIRGGKVMFGITFYDDLLFRSVPTKEAINARRTGSVIKFSGQNIALQSYPHLAPGKQISTQILPGELMPDVKQCEAHGWGVNARICSPHNDDLPCQHLRCASNNAPGECVDVGPQLVGTQCGTNGKICLDGRCVVKT